MPKKSRNTKKSVSKNRNQSKPDPTLRRRSTLIYTKLLKTYPDAHCALIHHDPFELLVATILSAQCTDARVNKVTPSLFKTYPDPQAMAKAKLSHIEKLIKSTGFYRNKAKSLQGSAVAIVQNHGGQVPDTMEPLLKLPGVARKTANVILGNAFGKNEGVVVDTHVSRLSKRMGLTNQKDPPKIEQDLIMLFPRSTWTMLAHLMIFHGRKACNARKPRCDGCPILNHCPQLGINTKG